MDSRDSLKKILLIEDETDIQLVARIALETIGHFQLEICSSGEEALHVAPRFEPQLILLDIVLPGLDGLKTLERLRELPAVATTPVVVVTARGRTAEVEEYERSGALAVIVKPFDPLTFAARLDVLWTAWREREGTP